jgi:hypothetical protein
MGIASHFKNPNQMVYSVIMLVVGLQVLVALLPTLFSGFTNLSAVSGLSFATFFQSGGVAFLLISVAILLGILGAVGLKKSGR